MGVSSEPNRTGPTFTRVDVSVVMNQSADCNKVCDGPLKTGSQASSSCLLVWFVRSVCPLRLSVLDCRVSSRRVSMPAIPLRHS